ncbi:unnamed protein product [Prorocentrum cordatum]|uniref:Fibronectin type-II domain-containing protein n=1 Tax=Prorocentrum cordatum TaxID=2364126 RepID=A0ABN9SII2_9DINO|nr:unnamed protein product [Polarella glacialis]
MRKWYADLPGTNKVKSYGPNGTLYLGYGDVRSRLEAFGEKKVTGQAQRQNELGIAVQNGVMWPNAPGGERTIFLGASAENHAFARPLLARVLDLAERSEGACDGSACWNRAWLSQRAREFVDGGRVKIDSSDFKWYVTQILHKAHMDIDLSEAEAREFADYMGKVILPVALPEGQVNTCPVRQALGISETQGRRSAYLRRYRAAIRTKFLDRDFTYEEVDLVASAFLDALQFAGGIAVPTMIQYVIALTHMREEDKWEQLKGLRLDEENIPSVVWEALRVYPPVGTFPYWEKDEDGNWKHIMLNIAGALEDEAAWEDPLTYKFRPMKEYMDKFLGFADFATHPPTAAGGAGPHEHKCPAKNLAIAIIETFLKEFEAVGPWHAADPRITVNSYMTSSYAVLRQDHTCWDAPKKCKPTFTYKGRQFHGCTSVDYELGGWCSTDETYDGRWEVCKPKLCRHSPCCCKTSACSTKALLQRYALETHGAGTEEVVCCKRVEEAPGSGECPGNWLFGIGYYKPAQEVSEAAGDGLCPAHDYAEQPPPYSPEQAEIDAMAAAHECQQTGDGGQWRAECICLRAGDDWQPGEDVARLVHRCTALTAVAQEVAAPWGCSVRRQTVDGQTRVSCEASAPLHVRLGHSASQAWDSLTRWGTEQFVPTDQCGASSAQCCSQSVLGTESATCQDVTSGLLTSAWHELPLQLQGVFWLQKQGDSSALMSFGRTSDGCGISPGSIQSDATYKVRVSGDRSWSFHSVDGGSFMLAELVDLIYDFHFDSATDPRFAQIIPEARNVLGVRVPSWLLSFNMSLVDHSSSPHRDSVVWRRQSAVPALGLDGSGGQGDYHLVQVIDGSGNRLPAFGDWVKYCEDPEQTGDSSPGKIWFHAYSWKGSAR